MASQDQPRSGAIAFGGNPEPSIEDAIRKEAATVPTRRAELEHAQQQPDDQQQQPAPSMAQPREPWPKNPVVLPLDQIEKLFAKSLDDIKSRLYGDIAEIETELAALKELVGSGTTAAQEYMSGYFGMSHSAQEITGTLRERVATLRTIVKEMQ